MFLLLITTGRIPTDRDKVDFWLSEAILDNVFGIWERIGIHSEEPTSSNYILNSLKRHLVSFQRKNLFEALLAVSVPIY